MQKRAFTLIELSIVLTIIGLLIGGSFKVMKMMREKAKTAEAKEQVLGAKNAVFGYAAKEYFLPLNSEFDANLSTSKDPNHPMFYTADNNLQYDDICAFTTTSLIVINRGSTINNVAFVVAHEGANYNMQTALIANVVTIHGADSQVDDNTTPVNIAEPYDDVVEWVTLKQLQDDVGCVDKQFRFVTDKLPNGKVGVQYPSLSGTAKLEVENTLPGETVSMDCTLRPQHGIDFNTTTDGFNFYGIPATATILQFNCNATVSNSNQSAQKKFSITIDPDYSIGASCLIGSDCISGYCASGLCTTGVIGQPCDNNGSDCKSGICYNNFCSGGFVADGCSVDADCVSGPCVSNACTDGGAGSTSGSGGSAGALCSDQSDCAAGLQCSGPNPKTCK